MKFAKVLYILLLLAADAPLASESPRWSFAVEVPFAGATVEYAIVPRHRLGFSRWRTDAWLQDDATHIYGARYRLVTGDGSHHGEFGLGVLVARESNGSRDDNGTMGVVSWGYRYERTGGGVQVRTGAAWHYGTHPVLAIVPLPYVSVGWMF